MTGHLQLKVFWAKKFLGLAIDQINTKQKLPLTIYYFWPKTEAWDQLKLELESKYWLNDQDKIKILNAATEIMNFWRTSRGTTTLAQVKLKYKKIDFLPGFELEA
jgi:30S ribosomal protein 3